jgi:hypothetical protein
MTGPEETHERETATARCNVTTRGSNGRFYFQQTEKAESSIVGFMLLISTSRRFFFTLTTTPPMEYNITGGLSWQLLVPCKASDVTTIKPLTSKKDIDYLDPATAVLFLQRKIQGGTYNF